MESTEQVLVVILAGALAVFLVLAIVIAVKIIQVLNALKRISQKAEEIADQAESIGEIFQKTAGPLAIGRLFAHLANTVFQHKQRSKRKSKGNRDD